MLLQDPVSGAGAGLTWNSGTSTLTPNKYRDRRNIYNRYRYTSFTSGNDIIFNANGGLGQINVSNSRLLI